MSSQRIRVTVDVVPLVIQPDAADVARFPSAQRGESVTPVPADRADRADGIQRYEVVVDGWLFDVITQPAQRAELRERVAKDAAAHQSASRKTLRAQIPGRVVRVWVTEGQRVEQGQRLLAIEAMKMENEIRAPQAGTVEQIRVEPGSKVERNEELLSLA